MILGRDEKVWGSTQLSTWKLDKVVDTEKAFYPKVSGN